MRAPAIVPSLSPLLLSLSPHKMFQVLSLALLACSARAQYTATYLPSDTPAQSETGQEGTNQCGTGYNQTSLCQNAYINSVQDFCVWAPPAGGNSTIANTEEIEVSWCTNTGYGTRLIPDGTITGAHFVQTPDYVQVTGVGNFTFMNIPVGDEGGELDPHGATGNGNPIGGLVFGSTFGSLQQYHEWTNFMSNTEFCFRACKDSATAPTMCNHIYDVMGCDWNMPANYAAGSFDNCLADSAQPMGVYGTSTFAQGQSVTPSAGTIPASSSCTSFSTISNGIVSIPTSTTSSTMQTAAPSIAAAHASGGTTSRNSGQPTATGTSNAAVGITAHAGRTWEGVAGGVGVAFVASLVGALFVL
ncbi:hypothetical protein BOTBODRAFT_36889 [Botryobasidium botryosum FD-172 SS1]|uniref:Carbohydrate-binding module family 13 protein n=1 Tax=Botryobasidium botryosum (strain FD-172 SS1) TaxID=930990 RepID=A0A067MDI4_BOTB1|nr:hypothetical protein BOTBODRAFT_36889 [Botryobasidium botryosum FD-172 SS1]